MFNPYSTGNWVKPPHFYGREELLSQLLRDNSQCVFLMGTRRIGKTSVLRAIEMQSSSITLFVNLQGAGTRQDGKIDPVSVISLLQEELNRKQSSAPELARDFGRIQPQRLHEAVRTLAVIAERLHISIVILWDEAEKLTELARSELEPLRSAMQDYESMHTILAASKRLLKLNDMCRDWDTTPFLNGFTFTPISALSSNEAAALVYQYNHPQGSVRVSDDLVETIIHHCGNHPFLIQRLCSRLWYRDHNLREMEGRDYAIDDQLDAMFISDFRQYSDSEQKLLQALQRRSPLNVTQLRQSTKMNEQTVLRFVGGLEDLAYVRSNSDSYELANIFFKNWLKTGAYSKAAPTVSDNTSLEILDDERQHLQVLHASHLRRLRGLERHAATFGIMTDPNISMQMEDLKVEIERIDMLLGKISDMGGSIV